MVRSALQAVAAASAELQSYGYRYNLVVGEETLTDVNLISARRRTSGAFAAQKFTTREERHIGADWSLDWDVWRLPSWRLRVQAKRQYRDGDPFRELNSQDGKRQLDSLIERAAHDKADPFYCFYLFDLTPLGIGTQPLVSRCCRHEQLTPDDFGCTLVRADTVRKVLKTRKFAMHDLQSACWPWSCLACPDGFDAKGRAWFGLGPPRGFSPRPFLGTVPQSVLAFARDPNIGLEAVTEAGYGVVIAPQ